MKNLFIPIFLLITSLVFGQSGSLPEKPKILIYCQQVFDQPVDKKNLDFTTDFESFVGQEIRKEIPCAEVITMNNIRTMLSFDRTKALLNPSGENNLDAIAQALGCDIFISLTIMRLNGKYQLSSSTFSSRTMAPTGSCRQGQGDEDVIKTIIQMAHKIVQDLLASEICPYKGTFTYSKTITSSQNSENNGLPNSDCNFHETSLEENKWEETWTFEKIKRYEANAGVNYSIKNYALSTEQTNCYHCQVMEDGYLLDQFEPNRAQMNFSNEKTYSYTVDKIEPIQETTFRKITGIIKIIFNTRANNYTIQVQAITAPGKWNDKEVHKASGCPYHKNSENEFGGMMSQRIDRTFGPFPGSPYQKELKQNITNDLSDPSDKGKSKATEKISFQFNR